MSNTYIDQRLITLNSDNATLNNGTFLSDVYFNFIGLLKDDPDVEEVQISVQNAQIPISFYNINIYNNVLELTHQFIPYTFTLTRGNYNSTTLIAEITSQFALQGLTTLQITISSITGKINITDIGLNPFTLEPTGTINKVLGFELNTTYNSVGNTLDAPYPLNLLGLLKIKIASYELQTTNYDSGTSGNLNVLATIPIEAGSFGLILYDNIANTQSMLNNPTLDGFDLKLYGDDNNLINFNGVGWNITLLLAITRTRREKSKSTFRDIVKPINTLVNLLQQDIQQQQEESMPPSTEEIQVPSQIEEPLAETNPAPDLANYDNPENSDETDLELLFYNQHKYL